MAGITTALFCGLGMGPAAGGALGEWLGYRPVFLIGAVLVGVNIWAVHRFLPAPAATGYQRKKREMWLPNSRRMLANRPLMGTWLVTFGANIIGGVFFTFMPLLAHHRGLEADQIGIVYLVQSVSNALSRIPFGSISDRLGRRGVQTLVGVVLTSLSIGGFARAGTFAGFLLAAIFLGISLAIAFTAIGALIAETTAPRFRGLAMGGYNSAIYFGLMTGSIGFGPVIEAAGLPADFSLPVGSTWSLWPFLHGAWRGMLRVRCIRAARRTRPAPGALTRRRHFT